MSARRARIGVVGTGWWATQVHIPALRDHEGADVVALADRDADKLKRVSDRFDVEHTFIDAEALYGSGLVDGVVIAVPHASHYSLAKAALEARLHVLVEKPMTLYASHAWDLVRTAERCGRHLSVGYTYQFTRTAQRCREAVQSGMIGDLLHVSGLFASMVESYYRGRPEDYAGILDFPVTAPAAATYSNPSISGGGQAQTQVTHAMGMVLWVTGAVVSEVSAYTLRRDLSVDLIDAIAYRTDRGALGTMGSTGSLRPNQPRQQELRYYGDAGFVLQDLRRGTVEIHRNDGSSEIVPPPGEGAVYPTHAPARGLADLIAGHGANLAPPEPAARTVEFVEATYRSARLGRSVRIDELEGEDIKEPWT